MSGPFVYAPAPPAFSSMFCMRSIAVQSPMKQFGEGWILLGLLAGLLLSLLRWIQTIGLANTDDPDGHVVLPVFEFAICGRRIQPA
jgi:hypothetical protein